MDALVAAVGAVSGVLWYFFAFLIVLTPLVFIHELGHFLVARIFNIRVETFSIGFGREIFGWTDRHGTRWKVSLLPFGGYVKFWGDEGAASVPDREKLAKMADENSSAALADCFHFKPLWQRAAVVTAGPLANFALALVVFVVMLTTMGDVRVPARVGSVIPDGAAARAGIEQGDFIIAIDGDEIRYFDQIPAHVVLNAGEKINIDLCRGGKVAISGAVVCDGGKTLTLVAEPLSTEVKDRFGNVAHVGQLGVSSASEPTLAKLPPEGVAEKDTKYFFDPNSAAAKAGFAPGDVVKSVNGAEISYFEEIARHVQQSSDPEFVFMVSRNREPIELRVAASSLRAGTIKATDDRIDAFGLRPSGSELITYNPIQAVGVAVERMVGFVKITLTYISRLAIGRGDPSQLSGPIGIAKAAGDYASVSLLELTYFAAVLSLSLGLINLFPIPMLDGGHLLYYAFEAVRGKPLGEKAQEIGFRIGLALVLFLMVFATWNDLAQRIAR